MNARACLTMEMREISGEARWTRGWRRNSAHTPRSALEQRAIAEAELKWQQCVQKWRRVHASLIQNGPPHTAENPG